MRSSSPIFASQYVFDGTSYIKASSPSSSSSASSSASSTSFSFFDDVLAQVLKCLQSKCLHLLPDIDTSFFPGYFASRTDGLFEFGRCGSSNVLALNTSFAVLKKCTDAFQYLLPMTADALDRHFGLDGALLSAVSCRKTDNMEMCHECMRRSPHLLLCDECPRSFCFGCLGIQQAPSDATWACIKCKPPIAAMGSSLALASSLAFSASAASAASAVRYKPRSYKHKQALEAKSEAQDLPMVFEPIEPSEASLMALAFDSTLECGCIGACTGSCAPQFDVSQFGACGAFEAVAPGAFVPASGGYSSGCGFSSGGGSGDYSGPRGKKRQSLDDEDEPKERKHRPGHLTKRPKTEPNLMREVFDSILASGQFMDASECPQRIGYEPENEWASNKLFSTLACGTLFSLDIFRTFLTNRRNYFGKPNVGSKAGGNTRDMSNKMEYVSKDLAICNELGFTARDVFDIFMECDARADYNFASAPRGVTYVFRK